MVKIQHDISYNEAMNIYNETFTTEEETFMHNHFNSSDPFSDPFNSEFGEKLASKIYRIAMLTVKQQKLQKGAKIQITNLKKVTELNGEFGEIVSYDPSIDRYMVKIKCDTFAIKEENIKI
jgi:hypothetical protein